MSIFSSYFRNPNYTQLLQLIVSFSLGVFFAPFSYGVFYLILLIIIYELAYGYFTGLDYPYWTIFFRMGIIYVTIFGFILGRVITGWCNPMNTNYNQCN